MGQLLSQFFNSNVENLVNFDTVELPDDEEAIQVYDSTLDILSRANTVFQSLKVYKGNEELIRISMSNQGDAEKELECFEGMFPNIETIKSFYDLSQEINEATRNLLQQILNEDGFESKPALAKALASLFEFAFRFDYTKMMCPAIQNDFSFYRRALGKHATHPALPVDDSDANTISMFVAQATPLMASLGSSLEMLKPSLPQLVPFLAEFAHVCGNSATVRTETHNPSPETVRILYSAMTVSIVLFDSLDNLGAFQKGSGLELKRCVHQLQAWDNAEHESLLNSLRYSTRTYKDAPASVKKLFAD